MPEFKRELGLWDLILFHLSAIFGLRWISIAAANGFSSISLWGLAFFCFFLPQAYVLLQLSRKWPVEGALYEWTKRALGPFHGFLSGWCYAVNNLTYYPTVLSTAAGYFTYVGFSGLAGQEQNKWYVFWFCLVALWLVLILQIVGLKIGKWVQNIGGISVWIPAGAVIVLGALYLFRFGSATPFTAGSLVPSFNLDTWAFWSLICFAFAGFELVTLLGGEIKNPEVNIPRSIAVAGLIGTLIYVLGTIALIVSLPHEKISMISGVLQVIHEQGKVFQLLFLSNILAIPLVLSNMGAVGAWSSGSGRILYAVGIDRYLPEAFSRIHPKWGTPHISLIAQGVISTGFLFLSVAGASVRQFWQLLLNATLIIYFIPYLYLFFAYLWFMKKKEMPWTASGLAASVVGFLATLISIAMSLIPPPEEAGKLLYEAKIVGGTLFTVAAGAFLYWRGTAQIRSNSR